MQKSKRGIELSGKVSASLEQIVAKARQVESLVDTIAHASEEQSRNVQGLNQSAAEVGKVTQTNTAAAEESAAAVQQLRAQTEALDDLVAEVSALLGETRADAVSSVANHRDQLPVSTAFVTRAARTSLTVPQ